MPWVNIFEQGDWQVYVRYVGSTSEPSPNSRGYLVRAQDLDPAVGTVTVDGSGLVVCNFEDLSGIGGEQPSVYVMPVTPVSASARLTCSGEDGLSVNVQYSYLVECLSVESVGADIYVANESPTNELDYASASEWSSPNELPSVIAEGSGMGFLRSGDSF